METYVVVVVVLIILRLFVVGLIHALTLVVLLVSTELREVAPPQGRVPE